MHQGSSIPAAFLRAGVLIAALAATASAAAAVQIEGDAAAGKKVTEFLCRNCHDVSGAEIAKSPPGGAPSFFEVANAPDTTAEKLHKFLGLPHGRMVNVLLTGKEVDNAVVYIIGMKRK